jgi:4-aminobutyrate aminotransferase-like enzyme/Ser/Thr protein kinase RdoA (MazF antagonist)
MTLLVQSAPRFSEADAVRLARDLYGTGGTAAILPSERDQNFKIESADSRAFVLKIANSKEQRTVLEMQHQALVHIAAQAAAEKKDAALCPQLRESVNGRLLESVCGPDGCEYLAWMVSYLPGKPLALAKPHGEGLLTDLGRLLGRLDRYLADFSHPAARRVFHWDLNGVEATVGRLLANIFAAERRSLMRGLLYRFVKHVVPLREGLRTQVIHNDGNDYNVLVSQERNLHRISGLLDFGDMVHSQLVNEPAVLCAYAMLDKPDPLAAACSVTAGYHGVNPLTETELAVLFELIIMRLCLSVGHSAQQSQADPGNTYLRISEQPAWALLERLAEVDPRLAHCSLRRACGLEPLKGGGATLKWIKGEASAFQPVVDVDLGGSSALGLDLSVGSPLLEVQGDPPPVSGMGPEIFAALRKANCRVGIGGYGNARFLPPETTCGADEVPSIHLGIDLFMAQDSPVFALAEGSVARLNLDCQEGEVGAAIIVRHPSPQGDYYSLYGGLAPASLAGWRAGMAVGAGQQLARIGGFLENGNRPPHLHFQLLLDLVQRKGAIPGAAPVSQAEVWMAIAPDPNIVLGIDPRNLPPVRRERDALLDLRKNLLGRNLSLAYEAPLKIVRGLRQYLIADDGRAYLDCVNNVSHVGHCHPYVTAVGQAQMTVLNTNTRYLHDGIVDYAQRLLATFPDPLRVCYFVCTGSEANELALRMARTASENREVIAVEGAYHGNTQALIDISPYKHKGPGGQGTPAGVHLAPMPCGYRGPHKGDGAETGRAYAAEVGRLASDLKQRGRAPAAFICESMLGCGGQVILPAAYLNAAFGHVRDAGGLCIADEVQTGFGRAGSHFWAFETQRVVPDIVTLGKPMGNGHPLAAVITTPEIADRFANGMEYFNTFGGNPVSCAIGQAVLDVLQEEALQENALQVGTFLLDELNKLKPRYPLVGQVRGQGLFIGIELVRDPQTLEPAASEAAYIVNRLKEFGILLSTDGPWHNVLKIKPPLVFTTENARQICAALEEILQDDCLFP